MRKFIAIIPARYQSSRFPGKPLADIAGKPMIQWVYETVSKVKCIDMCYVATDDKRIMHCIENVGGNAIMTASTHTCGSDRINECREILQLEDDTIILNIQGDEPLIKEGMIKDLMSAFNDEAVYMATLKKRITNAADLNDCNIVKVLTDKNDYAIIFSRCLIPYNRDNAKGVPYYKHIGAYG